MLNPLVKVIKQIETVSSQVGEVIGHVSFVKKNPYFLPYDCVIGCNWLSIRLQTSKPKFLHFRFPQVKQG